MLGKITFNNVLLEMHYEQEVKEMRSKGGIILPNGIEEEDKKKMHLYKEHPIQGTVMQVGEQVGDWLKEGDRVYLTNPPMDLIEDGVYYGLIRAHDIAYKINKDIWEAHLLSKEEGLPETNLTT